MRHPNLRPVLFALLLGLSAGCELSEPGEGGAATTQSGVSSCFVPTEGGSYIGPSLPFVPTTGARLPSGRVLLIRGVPGGQPLIASVDPVTGAAVTVPSPAAIAFPVAVSVGAKVVVLDTVTGPQATAWVYDEATGTWGSAAIPAATSDRVVLPLTSGALALLRPGNGTGHLFDPTALTVTPLPPMPSASSLGAAELPNGEILTLASQGNAARWSPVTNTWTAVVPPSLVLEPEAVSLPNGDVLFAGTLGGASLRYDVALQAFVPGPSPAVQSGALLRGLGTGDALYAGGADSEPSAQTQVFDTSSSAWFTGKPLHIPREDAVAIALPNGELFIAGGTPAPYASRAEIVVPCGGVDVDADGVGAPIDNCPTVVNASQNDGDLDGLGDACDSCTGWAKPPNPPQLGALGFGVSTLPDGRLLVTGGLSSGGTPSGGWTSNQALLFDTTSDTWVDLPNLSQGRYDHRTTTLADGRLLVTAGRMVPIFDWNAYSIQTAEVFSPATNTWSLAADLPQARANHTATRLADGRVLVTGGMEPSGASWTTLSDAWLYDPAVDAWSVTGSLATGRERSEAVLLPDGKVLIVGGWAGYPSPTRVATTEVYDPATGTFTPGPALGEGRASPALQWLPDGRLLIVGGSIGLSTDLFDPALGTLVPGPATPIDVEGPAATTPCGLAVMAQGVEALVLDPTTLTFTTLPMPPQTTGNPITLDDGRVMVFGSVYDWGYSSYHVEAATLDVCCTLFPDDDADAVMNGMDNCVQTANPGQEDTDADGLGDACDNCPVASNASQYDSDADGPGDACDPVCLLRQRGVSGVVEDAVLGTNPMDPTVSFANFGGNSSLSVGAKGTLQENALLRFDLSEVAPDAVVLSATLTLQPLLQVGSGTVFFYPVTTPWAEASVTAASFAGGFDGALAIATDVPSSHTPGAAVAVDLTALAQSWISVANHGVYLDMPMDGRVSYGSSEGAAGSRPLLSLCYARP